MPSLLQISTVDTELCRKAISENTIQKLLIIINNAKSRDNGIFLFFLPKRARNFFTGMEHLVHPGSDEQDGVAKEV